MKDSMIGVDLAKSVFQLHGASMMGELRFRKKLARASVERKSMTATADSDHHAAAFFVYDAPASHKHELRRGTVLGFMCLLC